MSENKEEFIDIEDHQIQDEVDLDGNLLKELVEPNQDIKDKEIEKSVSKSSKKKSKINFGFNKKSNKEGFINIDESKLDDENFVIVGQDNEKIKRGAKTTIKIAIYLVVIAIITSIVAFSLLFKFTDVKVQGSNKLIGNFYVTPSSYVANTSSLSHGDKILVSKQNDMIPYLFNYEKYTYQGRTGQLLTVLDQKGNEHIISAGSVTYIQSK